MRKRYMAVLILILILIGALGLRVGEVERSSYAPIGDAKSYLQLATEIAHRGDYARNDVGAGGSRGPTAYFPPGYPYFLAAVDLLDGHRSPGDGAVQPARLAQAVVGTAVVALIGLIALELFGGVVGLIALAVAAVYPPLIELSSVLVAETLLVALMLGAVWSVLRARRSDRPYAWCALAGVLSGLATLTHDNGFLVLIPLAFALWALPATSSGSLARRARAPVLLIATAVLTIAPWTIRNAVVLDHFVPVSDETGITLAGTYNPSSARAERIPYHWIYYAAIPSDATIYRHAHALSEPALSSQLERRALDYIGDHPLAPLQVAFHNTLRLLELEGSFAWWASAASIGLSGGTAEVGVFAFWLLCALALVGGFTAAARATPRWLWTIPVLLAISVVLVNAETPRFREPVDPFLILLAACSLERATRRLWPRLRRAPVGSRVKPAAPARSAELVEMVERLA